MRKNRYARPLIFAAYVVLLRSALLQRKMWKPLLGVTVNSTGGKHYFSSSTSGNYTVTVPGSLSNGAMVLTLNFGSKTVSGITCTWDPTGANQSMTQIIAFNGSVQGTGAVFGLRNPTAVTGGTLAIAWTGSAELFVDAVICEGVEQSSDGAAFPHSVSGDTVATVNLTSATGNLAVACEASGSGQGTSTGTLLYDDHTTGGVINAMAQYDAGSATVTIGNSGSNSTIVAVDVKASSGTPASAALTGTMASAAPADVVAGGKTTILTITGDTLVASGATFDAERQNIIDGVLAATSQTHGWNNEVRANQAVTGVVRTSATVITITWGAEASYAISATETMTATIPGTALTGGSPIVATPTFSISPSGAAFNPALVRANMTFPGVS